MTMVLVMAIALMMTMMITTMSMMLTMVETTVIVIMMVMMTLLVAVILYAIGTGPVKGFAITLSIGIVTSMFTAIIGTRALVNLFYGGRTVKKLAI